MSLIRVVTQGGPGGILLLLYIIGSGYIWSGSIDTRAVVFVAVVAAFLLPLYVELDSDRAIRFISYPIIKQSKEQIDDKTGDEDYYHDHPDKQAKLDNYDEKTYRYTVLVYAGAFIIVTALAQAVIIDPLVYTVVGIAVALTGAAVSYLAFQNLRKTIKTSPELYG